MRTLPGSVALRWAGREYLVTVPQESTLPAFLVLEGIADPPPGELVLVLRRKPGVLSLLRPVRRFHAAVRAAEAPHYLPDASPHERGD